MILIFTQAPQVLQLDLFQFGVYQNKCVNGIYKKLKNNLVAEPVGPVKNGFFSQLIIYQPSRK